MTHAAQGGGGHLVPAGPKQDLAPLMVAAKGQDLLLMGPLCAQPRVGTPEL